MSQPRSRMSDCLPDLLIDVAAGVTTVGGYTGSEKRISMRQPYTALVGLILVNADETRGKPMAVRAKDLSATGICVTARTSAEIGQRGAIQLVRSNGTTAVVGVRVQHCRQFGELAGGEIGMQFMPMPRGLSAGDFLDEHQRLRLIDPLLGREDQAAERRSA